MNIIQSILFQLVLLRSINAIEVKIHGLGTVRGISRNLVGHDIDVFQGIPFAKPPVGKLRFKAPVKVSPWRGVYNATTAVINCPQKNFFSQKIIGKEDCLYLSIYRPKVNGSGLLPVMVWIHGGAFKDSSGSDYNGEMLAAKHKVVVVIPNYRLGILGFFNIPGTSTKGNYGLLDQISALKWTKSHIRSFNGDPNRVSLFAISAGASSATLLMLSPLSKGLFSRVIAESQAAICHGAIQNNKNPSKAIDFAKKLDCSMAADKITDCIRGKTWQEIINQQILLSSEDPSLSPNVDGEFMLSLPHDDFEAGKLPVSSVELLSGFNKDEGTMFLPKLPGWNEAVFKALLKGGLARQYSADIDQVTNAVAYNYERYQQITASKRYSLGFIDFITDYAFAQCMINFAEKWAKVSNTSYLYEFTYQPRFPNVPQWLVSHGIEVDFVFGKPFYQKNHPGWRGRYLKNYTADDRIVSENVMKMWTDFAKTGKPGKNWPKYNESQKQYLDIGLNLTVKERPRPKSMAFWHSYVPGLVKANSKCLKPTAMMTKTPAGKAIGLQGRNTFTAVLVAFVYFCLI